MMELQVTLALDPTQEMRAQIAAFQAECSARTTHQSIDWPRLNPLGPRYRVLYFTALQGDVIRGAGVVRVLKVAGKFSVAALQRGPVTAQASDVGPVLAALETALYARGVITLNVNPHWTGAAGIEVQRALADLGYRPVPRALQNFPTATAIIDTVPDQAEMMAAMTQTGRRHLRKAMKAGVTCRPLASLVEAKRANEIMHQMAVETGLITDSQHDFCTHFEYLQSNPGAGSILVTEVNGEMFGAAVNYLEGSRGFNMLLTTSSQVNVPRAYMLMWESILSMKAMGAETFDMVGFPDDSVESDTGMKTRGAFKHGFGPEIVKLPPVMTKPLRPLLHAAFSAVRAFKRKRQSKRIQAQA